MHRVEQVPETAPPTTSDPAPTTTGEPDEEPAAEATPDADLGSAGDPYFPDYGSSGYDATRYTVAVDFDPGKETLTGRVVVAAQATESLSSFYLDLALPAWRWQWRVWWRASTPLAWQAEAEMERERREVALRLKLGEAMCR